MKYKVIFSQNYEYTVEAKTESEAIDSAYDEFISEMRYPAVNTHYDDVEAEVVDDGEEE